MSEIGLAIKTALYILVKFFVGFFVVSIALILTSTWKWWEEKTGVIKIALGFFYIPASGFMRTVGAWWSEF